MDYNFNIRKHNVLPHLDIEKDLSTKTNGLFTFTLRINKGDIVDYNLTEQIDVKAKYFGFSGIVIERIV